MAAFVRRGSRSHVGGDCHERIVASGFSQPGNWTKFGLQQSLREVTMPVYDYVCKKCRKSFELVLTLSEHDKGGIRCPKCGSKKVEQEFVAFFAVTSKKS
ncbi:MAG: zinc ribbon domain-containing protein [Acidobacteriota bacterium]|nr:zinc ribbon domain-containing protein [Acidobacteriota bacterium]